MRKLIVPSGTEFGKLTVMQEALPKITPLGRVVRMFRCQCECGTETTVQLWNLSSGHTQSCGCIAEATKPTLTHGLSGDWLFLRWKGMVRRCEDHEHPCFAWYGGRGIRVCEEWRDPKAFIEWAMANGADQSLEIDRIDNNGNYSPTNCRFTTREQNMRNTRGNKMVVYQGEEKCIAEWCECLHLNYDAILSRISTRGWDVVRAFETPVCVYRKRH